MSDLSRTSAAPLSDLQYLLHLPYLEYLPLTLYAHVLDLSQVNLHKTLRPFSEAAKPNHATIKRLLSACPPQGKLQPIWVSTRDSKMAWSRRASCGKFPPLPATSSAVPEMINAERL